MMTTLYRKQGRRYVPVAEYDPQLYDSLPAGSHLIYAEPGLRSTHVNVEPAHAPVLAALREHRGAMLNVLVQASVAQPSRRPMSAREQRAYQAYAREMGEETEVAFTIPSLMSVLDALDKSLCDAVGRSGGVAPGQPLTA